VSRIVILAKAAGIQQIGVGSTIINLLIVAEKINL
jgi:hypothetical protein